ncbi:MAG TPA: response regulator [Pirellulales bacterium]|nr:response regulator [Pirellulales bacterium]
MAKLLVADGDSDTADVLADALRLAGHDAHACYSTGECLALVDDFDAALVFLDGLTVRLATNATVIDASQLPRPVDMIAIMRLIQGAFDAKAQHLHAQTANMVTNEQLNSACQHSNPAHRLRVMVVEDAWDVAQSLEALVEVWGHDCRVCTSGNEAIALAPYFRPNVVLIDIGLPDMDGWQLAGRLEGSALLVAVTARGEDTDFQRSQIAGIRYHLVKPAFHSQLKQLLDRVAPQ